MIKLYKEVGSSIYLQFYFDVPEIKQNLSTIQRYLPL